MDLAPRAEPLRRSAFDPDELAAIVGGRLVLRGRRPIRGAAVDSRLVTPGRLFVALPGERTDGHRFLGEALARGAAALLVRADWPLAATDLEAAAAASATICAVPETLPALHALAAAWRRRFDPLVVGVTGSIAKTSTKEAIATVLARRFRTLKNPGNLNNEIGLPLTVLDLDAEHEVAVLEMGMYVGGEIADLARIARPRLGVVTAVQEVHLSRIGSLDAIEAAKAELVEALPPAAEGGLAILNADDERVARMRKRTAAAIRTYGFAPEADVTARAVRPLGFEGMAFDLVVDGLAAPVRLPVLGRLGVHNALAAAAVASALGLEIDEIAAGLAGGWSVEHRGTIVRAGGVALVDDAYNASPGSVRAALDLLAGLPGRRIAVLGEMLELGPAHDRGHRSVGEAAAAVVDHLVVVGDGARGIAEGALAAGLSPERLTTVADREAARAVLLDLLRPGDVVLVKASRGIALDALVAELAAALADPGSEDPAGGRR
ncbi:MAG TPA: UDP-N-acetylmuramoyl-tripeptide--D-alanyl-D-alanine ligase [Candidatus Binatia bacterium]|nr:UDP-N-acetylmuramoyl-tripeptide--D-alanyl-D-alanine ligase [Candidatus Binatia bacterium]